MSGNGSDNDLMDVVEVFLRNATIEYKVTDFRPGSELRIFSADCTETSVISMPTDYCAFRYNLLYDYPLTSRMYRIVRNLPFAYRGYVFKTEALARFFGTRWWYVPDPDYRATLESLTPEEREWLKLFEERAKSLIRH